ncbi:ribonucleotide-diphosphate reductase subunit beta [Cryobacterium sp. TmT2-59]|uniref:Ribonucleotide-diphosphate reductase subunit beta n=1 Tax=Cryobacterium shii TaxID=1259235 RepID=A0AAQ2C5E8_9MICO|nr:ribonucleotide-diphosphate reductase subunit beta [Cryobacterium shii]TFC82128.1 ribonucleotide-diphosphate reductase subunit beta [Cryobacterium sp. TmT2-59]
MDRNGTLESVALGEYKVPVDPMDELQCDSCQRASWST